MRPLVGARAARIVLALFAAVLALPLCLSLVSTVTGSHVAIALGGVAADLLALGATVLLARAIADVLSVRAGSVFTWLAWAAILGCLVTYAIALGSAE